MNEALTEKLKILRELQARYPTAHVGGSVGLWLRGVNLKRYLGDSDLDITIDELPVAGLFVVAGYVNWDQSSNAGDFDFSFKANNVKIDVRINPEPSFDVVEFEGEKYNVSRYQDIIFWKNKYAKRGHQKHIDDLEVIETGVRVSKASPLLGPCRCGEDCDSH